jgi:class 3 adenylate cyclase
MRPCDTSPLVENVVVRFNAVVDKPRQLDVLLALVGPPVDGLTLSQRLEDAGKARKAGQLLGELLALETSGHVNVERAGGDYRFSLTELGEESAGELGPGRPTDLVLVMADLVGFVAFTASHDDLAAQQSAQLLERLAHDELRREGGRVVKSLGDGVLGALPLSADAVGALERLAHRLEHPDGGRWPIRAAAHAGRPIVLEGDVFGHDVNLVSRLCAAAGPNELLVSGTGDRVADEVLVIRGLDEPVAIHRHLLDAPRSPAVHQ